jgi:hypothetical protein
MPNYTTGKGIRRGQGARYGRHFPGGYLNNVGRRFCEVMRYNKTRPTVLDTIETFKNGSGKKGGATDFSLTSATVAPFPVQTIKTGSGTYKFSRKR